MRRWMHAAIALLVLHLGACQAAAAKVDPDDRDARDLDDEAALVEKRVRTVPLADVVAASAGTTRRRAPVVLGGWLDATPTGRALSARWPRTPSGALDFAHAPIAAREVRVLVDRASRSRCGDVLLTLRGGGPPTLRLRIALPSTTRACRNAGHDVAIEGLAALDALDEAIAADVAIDDADGAP
jgi:hypothetical protein